MEKHENAAKHVEKEIEARRRCSSAVSDVKREAMKKMEDGDREGCFY